MEGRKQWKEINNGRQEGRNARKEWNGMEWKEWNGMEWKEGRKHGDVC